MASQLVCTLARTTLSHRQGWSGLELKKLNHSKQSEVGRQREKVGVRGGKQKGKEQGSQAMQQRPEVSRTMDSWELHDEITIKVPSSSGAEGLSILLGKSGAKRGGERTHGSNQVLVFSDLSLLL